MTDFSSTGYAWFKINADGSQGDMIGQASVDDIRKVLGQVPSGGSFKSQSINSIMQSDGQGDYWSVEVPLPSMGASAGTSNATVGADHSHPNNSDPNGVTINVGNGNGKSGGGTGSGSGNGGNVGKGNDQTTKYAALNHTHNYGFADFDGIKSEDGFYVTACEVRGDGKQPTSATKTGTHPETGESTFGSLGGECPFPARADHSHPLNVVDKVVDGALPATYIKPVGSAKNEQGKVDPTLAAFGGKNYYARVDHIHPVATGATGATGIGTDVPTPTPKATPLYGDLISTDSDFERQNPPFNQQEWVRDTDEGKKGFKMQICCGFELYKGVPHFIFREIEIDACGVVRKVSKAKMGVMCWYGL